MTCTSHLDRLYSTLPAQRTHRIAYRPVNDVHELKQAMDLVSRKYAQRGYIDCPEQDLKQTLFQALPTTTTFIAEHKDLGIIGTLTLIEDSDLGLPMDELYRPQLDALRRRGHHIAEASMFTIDTQRVQKQQFPKLQRTNFSITLNLFKELFDYLRSQTKATELLACINPKHEALYRFLHFDELGERSAYPSVNGHWAVGKHLNIKATQAISAHYPVLRFFYDLNTPERFATRALLSKETRAGLFAPVHALAV